jgi:hypothetical protein
VHDRRRFAARGLAPLLALTWCAVPWSTAPASPAHAETAKGEVTRPAFPGSRRTALPALARDTLARVGNDAVTALDLVQRIEWMPWPEKRNPASLDSARVRGLQSLVAERLLDAEAGRLGLGESGAVPRMRRALRKALARDALYRDVVSSAPAPDAARIDAIVRREFPHARTADLPALRHQVADSLRQTSEMERGNAFMARQLAGRSVTVDSVTFMLFADSLRAVMLALRESGAPGSHRTIPGEASDVLRSRLAPYLDRALARLPDGPLTLGDALEDLRFYSFPVTTLQRQRFAMELNDHLRAMVEGEWMAREALRRGYGDHPDVRHDLDMWTGAWRAQQALARVPRDSLDRHLADLADQAGLGIDYPALRRVSILPSNMVVKRNLGFGGGMLAAPSLVPMWEWVEVWRARRTALP